MNAWLILLGVLTAPSFDVRAIPLPEPGARVFVGNVDADARNDLVVFSGRTLTAYPTGSEKPLALTFPEGIGPFDLASVDEEGGGEVIAVFGHDIVEVPWSSEPPTALFSAPTDFAGLGQAPHPRPLIASRQGQPVVVLPQGGKLELRSVSGEVLQTLAPRQVTDGKPPAQPGFSSWAYSTEPSAFGGGLWIQAVRHTGFEFDLPDDLLRPPGALHRRRPDDGSQAFYWGDAEALAWPNTPIHASAPVVRAHYSLAGPHAQETLVAVRQGEASDGGATGPAQPFPGVLVVFPNASPDFNGDGYGDLLLWRTPEPGTSLQSIVRTVTGGTWPIRFTVHLYSPEKGRFEARPTTGFLCRVPLAWLLDYDMYWPLRNGVARDFNGDGRTDLGMSLTGSDFAVWLMRPEGFSAEPDFRHDFKDEVKLELEEDWDGKGHWAVGLKSKSSLHLVRYAE